MVLTLPSEAFHLIARGHRTGVMLSEGQTLRFAVGDHITIEEIADDATVPTSVAVVVTDVLRQEGHDSLLSIRRVCDLTDIPTPGGTLRVEASLDMIEDYPGFSVYINNQLAAVVEWHLDEHTFALRTYNEEDGEPQHYHRWDGTLLNP